MVIQIWNVKDSVRGEELTVSLSSDGKLSCPCCPKTDLLCGHKLAALIDVASGALKINLKLSTGRYHAQKPEFPKRKIEGKASKW